MKAVNKWFEFLFNLIIILGLIFSLFSPSPVYANDSQIVTTNANKNVKAGFPEPDKKQLIDTQLLAIPLNSQVENSLNDDLPPQPKLENIGFRVTPSNNLIDINKTFTIKIEIQNNSKIHLGK
jgi:hypothetical protein